MIFSHSLLPTPYSRLDAVAHGVNPQDRAASLLPIPDSLFPIPCSRLQQRESRPVILVARTVVSSIRETLLMNLKGFLKKLLFCQLPSLEQ